MTCPKCHAALQEPSNFCPYCGVDLRERRSYRGWITVIAACLLLSAAAVFFFASSETFYVSRYSADRTVSAPPAALPENAAEPKAIDRIPFRTDEARMQLTAGITTIYDIAGNLIKKFPAAVVANGWLALPADVCLGGYLWQFTRSNGDVLEIVGGIIGEQDEMGLWQLPYDHSVLGPRLSSWIPGRALSWSSIVSESSVNDVAVSVVADQRYVVKTSAPAVPHEPGVFLQDDHVVGWTFGGTAKTGFLWNGLAGEDLVYDISVYDYYRATFENGREEQFILSIAQSDAVPALQLAAFADAFLLDPKLTVAATPSHLRPVNIVPRMRALIARLIQNGQHAEAADAFDGPRLAAAGDTALVIDAVGATLTSYGFDAAVDLIEAVQSADPIGFTGNPPEELETAHRQLYGQWLTFLIQDADILTARQVYDRADAIFPQDPKIRLLGVELALALGDWPSAQRLLAVQAYPVELADRVALLKSQIAAARSEEGQIIIRFNPGSRQIPVTADLGDGFKQNFVIDTGATMVTIPRLTAEKLGVSEDRSSLRRQIQTAGGIVDAYEVVIPSVQLGDSRVENVRALVLDLPNQPNVGLLGMNYLSLFRMNINTDMGELTLAPR
jgi:clan AA aspartic protease (TIGR02281 family)